MNNHKPPGRNNTSESLSSHANALERQFKSRKRWMIAQSRNVNSRQHNNNNVTLEMTFAVILARAKRLYAGSHKLAFERNFKRDQSAPDLPMHCFHTECMYLYLECALDHNFVIQYAFNDCKHEAQLKELLKPLKYIGRVEEVQLKPSFAIHFKNVLAFQAKSFQYLL
jgi:hypothetical protein